MIVIPAEALKAAQEAGPEVLIEVQRWVLDTQDVARVLGKSVRRIRQYSTTGHRGVVLESRAFNREPGRRPHPCYAVREVLDFSRLSGVPAHLDMLPAVLRPPAPEAGPLVLGGVRDA